MSDFKDMSFNIIKRRGDPKSAITHSGHFVEKQEYVYLRDDKGLYQNVRCADYHNEHFIYVDPQFNVERADGQPNTKRGWFAMCTCGSPAVLVGRGVGALGTDHFDYGEMLLVCMIHTQALLDSGIGRHQTSSGRQWW